MAAATGGAERIHARQRHAAVQHRADAERGDPVPELVEGDDAAGTIAAADAGSCSWPKLIVSGRRAEQPSPASPKATNSEHGLAVRQGAR